MRQWRMLAVACVRMFSKPKSLPPVGAPRDGMSDFIQPGNPGCYSGLDRLMTVQRRVTAFPVNSYLWT